MPSRWRWPPENSCGYLRHALGPQADAREQLGHAPLLVLARGDAEILHRLADDGAGGEARIERRVGVLEHDLHAAAMLPHLRRREARDVDAAEHDAARRRLDELEHQAADRGLAAARFADEPERLPAPDREADAVDRLHHAAAAPQQPADNREMLDEALDLEDCGRAHAAASATRWASQHATRCEPLGLHQRRRRRSGSGRPRSRSAARRRSRRSAGSGPARCRESPRASAERRRRSPSSSARGSARSRPRV